MATLCAPAWRHLGTSGPKCDERHVERWTTHEGHNVLNSEPRHEMKGVLTWLLTFTITSVIG
jgi:hypothetical protein